MTPVSKFALRFAPQVVSHLTAVERKYYGLIRQTIEEHLQFQPETETRNRKPLAQPAPYDATWELRFGPSNRFRVFYSVHEEGREVWILALGIKEGNHLWIAGEEFEL